MTGPSLLTFFQTLTHHGRHDGDPASDPLRQQLSSLFAGEFGAGAELETESEAWFRVNSPGLRFYKRSARHRRLGFLRHVYPRLMRALPKEARQALENAWLAHHAGTDLDWVRNTCAFPELVARVLETAASTTYFVAVARHEWALFEADHNPQLPVAGPTFSEGELAALLKSTQLNPTLDVRSYACDPLRDQSSGDSSSAREHAVHVAYYLDPLSHRGRFLRVDERTLAVMQVIENAADKGAKVPGLEESELRSILNEYVAIGLLCATPGEAL